MNRHIAFYLTLVAMVLACQSTPAKPPVTGNQLFTIGGTTYHAYVDGDPLTRRGLLQRLTAATGIKDFGKRKDGTPQVRIYLANYRAFTMEEAQRARAITYPYGYAFDFDGKTFRILAKNHQGLNYAAVDFLRRYCTYRKFGGYPDAVLKRPPYKLPQSVHQVIHPSVASLTVAWGGDAHFDRNVRTTIFSTHSLWQVLPPEKFVDSHPEYYPLINGIRRLPSKDRKSDFYYGVWQPCLVNPDLVRLTMEYAEGYFKRNPHNLSLPVGVNDGGGSCHCPGCEELMRTYNNQYIPYYNAVAREVAKKYPGKMVSFIAYGEAAPVPQNITLEPNILVEVANGIGDRDCHRLEAWKKAGARNFGAYQYYNTIGSGYVVPQYFPRTVGESWKRAFKTYGIKSLWTELYPHTWIFASPRQYVLCSLAWDMNQEVEPLLDEYFTIVYGKASQDIKALFDIFEKRHRFLFNSMTQIEGYTEQDARDMDRLLKQAEQRPLAPNHRENLRLLKVLMRYVRPHIQVAAAFNSMQGKQNQAELSQLAERISHACQDLDSLTMSNDDQAKIFINRAGRPDANGLKNLQGQSALNLSSYAEQRLDSLLSTMKLDWQALRRQTTSPILKAIYGTQLCRHHRHSHVNLCTNPSFERPNHGMTKASPRPEDQLPFQAKDWRFWAFPNSKYEILLDTHEHATGNCAGAIGLNRLGACLITDFNLQPGCRYRIAFKVKQTKRASVSAGAMVRFFNEKGEFVDDGSPIQVAYPQESNGSWATCVMNFSPLKGARIGMLQLSAPYQSAEQRIWFDDVTIEKIFQPDCNEH